MEWLQEHFHDRMMNFRSNAPRPHYKCIPCLWRLGLGYDRVSRLLRCKKKTVYRIAKRQKNEPLRPKHPHKATILKPIRTIVDNTKLKEGKFQIRLERLSNKKLKVYLRTKVWKWFKHGLNPKSSPRLVGCERSKFIQHITSQFVTGMTIENYGPVWHLDHIMPCKKFDLKNAEHRKLCFHFTNYQPMFSLANKSKSARVTTHQPELIFCV